jgi:uncharacterized iron-regulated protein
MEFKKMIKNSLYLFVGTMMTASMTGCNDDSNTSDTTSSSSQEQILQSVITDYVDCTIIPTYRGMADASIELHNACLAMRNAGTGNVTTEMVQTAGNAWIKARRYWELSEAWLYGAAGDYNIDPHIDSWPLDKTAMDNLLNNPAQMAQMDPDGYYVGNMLGYGLLGFHAIEYMLFELDATGTESLPHHVNYTEPELNYLAAVAGDLRNQCIRLEASWAGMDHITNDKQQILTDAELEPSFDYGSSMKNAGSGGSKYINYNEAVQELIVGAQDIADEVGGLKIGNPTGHGEEDNPDYIESPYSLNSITDFTDNIISIRNAYQGCQDTDDYIKPVNSSLSSYVQSLNPELDTRMKNAIQDAIDKIGQMREPFAKTARDPQFDAINQAAIAACNNVTDVLNEVLNLLTAH